ncbi:DNA repair protein RAD51 homolog 4 isoform X7 [Anolis carolinensis]|uniref:DNA repair protein RAD51 homolog 4 isoform X7 n=1 Tax=Anolis carolinensis TaxID=28377 RepID=UPI002F2B5491
MTLLRPGLCPGLTPEAVALLREQGVHTVVDLASSDLEALAQRCSLSFKGLSSSRRLLLARFSSFPANGTDLFEELHKGGAILPTGTPRSGPRRDPGRDGPLPGGVAPKPGPASRHRIVHRGDHRVRGSARVGEDPDVPGNCSAHGPGLEASGALRGLLGGLLGGPPAPDFGPHDRQPRGADRGPAPGPRHACLRGLQDAGRPAGPSEQPGPAGPEWRWWVGQGAGSGFGLGAPLPGPGGPVARWPGPHEPLGLGDEDPGQGLRGGPGADQRRDQRPVRRPSEGCPGPLLGLCAPHAGPAGKGRAGKRPEGPEGLLGEVSSTACWDPGGDGRRSVTEQHSWLR